MLGVELAVGEIVIDERRMAQGWAAGVQMKHLHYALKVALTPLRGTLVFVGGIALLAIIQFSWIEGRSKHIAITLAIGYALLALGLKLFSSAVFGLFVGHDKGGRTSRSPLFAWAIVMFLAACILLLPLFAEVMDMVRQYENLA